MDKYINFIIKYKQGIFLLIFLIILFLLFKPQAVTIEGNPTPQISKEEQVVEDEASNLSNLESPTQISNQTQTSTNYIYIDLRGAVKKPDIYKIDSTLRLNDLITLAGGLDQANNDCINLAQPLSDGTRIDIPYSNQECNETQSSNLNASGSTDSPTSEVVNINTADSEQLQTLTGIGEGKANQIIIYREENGPFQKIEDIMNVSGIGESSFEKIKDSICI